MTDSQLSKPLISALFLVVFDNKVGYTTAWHRETTGVSIDGVEFRSLPSGLHDVAEDIAYFSQGPYIGVSAFVRGDSDAAHRNAEFASVGVLLKAVDSDPLATGWTLVEELQSLARGCVGNVEQVEELEQFWEARRVRGETQQHQQEQDDSTQMSTRQQRGSIAKQPERRMSVDTSKPVPVLLHEDDDSPHNPILSLPSLLDQFGPLLFPLHRATLRRQRILFLGSAPVQQTCHAIYILSLLADLSDSPAQNHHRNTTRPPSRISPLFNIGIYDIDTISKRTFDGGWLACTTDDIFRDKTTLHDILVELPNPSSSTNTTTTTSNKKPWPHIRTSSGTQIKATQRDLRRYKLLRLELRRMRLERRIYHSEASSTPQTPVDNSSDADRDELLRRTHSVHASYSESDELAAAEVVEPITWTEFAYNGLMCWASAGDMDAFLHAEIEADRALLDDLPDVEVSLPGIDADSDDFLRRHQAQAIATVVVAYFRQLTAQMVRVITNLANDGGGGGGGDSSRQNSDFVGGGGEIVIVTAEDMMRIGLDAWSASDKRFVEEAMKTLTGREAVVDAGGLRICGMRVC